MRRIRSSIIAFGDDGSRLASVIGVAPVDHRARNRQGIAALSAVETADPVTIAVKTMLRDSPFAVTADQDRFGRAGWIDRQRR